VVSLRKRRAEPVEKPEQTRIAANRATKPKVLGLIADALSLLRPVPDRTFVASAAPANRDALLRVLRGDRHRAAQGNDKSSFLENI
jgi:hypothetical protein